MWKSEIPLNKHNGGFIYNRKKGLSLLLPGWMEEAGMMS